MKGGKYAAMLLGESTTLEHLDVGDSDQTLASVMYFMSMIRTDIGTNRSLKVFDISRIIPYTVNTQYNPETLAKALSEMLRVCCSLKKIKFAQIYRVLKEKLLFSYVDE